jgi:hypothetical protein
MPALRTYKVTRVQSIEVRSTNALDAQIAAIAYFDEAPVSSEVGRPEPNTTKVSLASEELR